MKTAMITRTALGWLVILGLCGYAFVGQIVYAEAEDGSYASNPIPADGAVITGTPINGDIYTTLDFTPGEDAVSHEAFFSDDLAKVESRDPCVSLGPPPYLPTLRYYVGLYAVEPYTDSLVRGTKYYWCVDETDALDNTYPGDIWEFTIQDYKACCPDPPDGAVIVGPDVLLSWVPGFGAEEHDVYFGTDFDDVNNAVSGPYDPYPLPEYLDTVEEPNRWVTGLSENTTYYWRVDEVSRRFPPLDPGQIYKGDVWCFKIRGPWLFVDADATGANDGSSWADAFNYLQDAVSIAWPGAEIRVAQGTYKPDQGAGITPGDREATFQFKNGVTLEGGYAGFGEPDPNSRDINLYETILTGDLVDNDVDVNDPMDLLYEPTRVDNSYHVLTGSNTDDTTILDGFTITAGHAQGNKYGGGMYNHNGSPTILNCTFTKNWAEDNGGGMFNSSGSPLLVNCKFTFNATSEDDDDEGGSGIFNDGSSPILVNCVFIGNWADFRGGGMYNKYSNPTLTNCTFSKNWAEMGGAIYNYRDTDEEDYSPTLNNCTFSGNSANTGGAMYNRESSTTLTNCTFSGNLADNNGGGMYNYYSNPTVTNCIFWGNIDFGGVDESAQIYNHSGAIPAINYCCVQGWTGSLGGIGNIGDDPLFVDADGIDNIIGTEDDNLRLSLGSPCIDAGDNTAVPPSVLTDLDGNPRIANYVVDMGAYEFQGPFRQCYYVDAVNGDDNNDGLTLETAFATIQKGIDTAIYRDSVIVYPAVYDEELLINNKSIKLQGVATSAGIPILQKVGNYAVSYYVVDGPDSLLKNFVIRGSELGILIVGGSPTISNLTVVDNVFGIAAYANAQPDISNCIFWNNTDGDLFGDPDPIEARYSCVQQGSEGDGNISIEPGFVDVNSGDYHLLSERGRYWPAHDVWVLDEVTSPCVDGGDPAVDPSNERMPNGGRINMGAYGNTAYASMSEWPIEEDNNRDGIVNMIDMARLAARWLEKLDWVE